VKNTIEVMVQADFVYSYSWPELVDACHGDQAQAIALALRTAEDEFREIHGSADLFEAGAVNALRDVCVDDKGDCQTWTVFPEDRSYNEQDV